MSHQVYLDTFLIPMIHFLKGGYIGRCLWYHEYFFMTIELKIISCQKVCALCVNVCFEQLFSTFDVIFWSNYFYSNLIFTLSSPNHSLFYCRSWDHYAASKVSEINFRRYLCTSLPDRAASQQASCVSLWTQPWNAFVIHHCLERNNIFFQRNY